PASALTTLPFPLSGDTRRGSLHGGCFSLQSLQANRLTAEGAPPPAQQYEHDIFQRSLVVFR
ncbi:MAG TPA: hypothetical protein PLD59_13525, partial [Tepidisphaeraceae bacterium]|nr:hypothetical protein [Tepidisphaeraceae bacterium]